MTRTASGTSARRMVGAAVGLCLALGLALRAFHLTAQNLWVDEIETVRVATTPVPDLGRRIQAGELQPTAWLSTFYYVVLKGSLAVLPGPPETNLRLSSALLGAATIPVFAWAAFHLVPVPVALTAAFLLAVSPFHVWYSQEVRPYVLLVLLATLVIGAWRRALETNAGRWWAAAAGGMALALYTHPIALALPTICLLALAAAAVGRRALLGRGLAALVVTAVLYLPAVALIGSRGANNPADTRAVSVLDVPYAFYAYAVGFSLGPSTTELREPLRAVLPVHAPVVALAALVFGLLVVAGLAGLRSLGRTDRIVVLAWLVVPLGLALAGAMASPNPFNVRYAIIAFPAFLTLVALGAWSLGRLTGVVPAGAVVLGLALVLSAASLQNHYFEPRYAKEAAGALGTLLEAETTDGDLILVNAPYMASTIDYYYPGPAPVVGYPPFAILTDVDGLARDLSTLIAGRTHVWLVLSRTFQGDREGILRGLLGERMHEEREVRLPGIVAYRFGERLADVRAESRPAGVPH